MKKTNHFLLRGGKHLKNALILYKVESVSFFLYRSDILDYRVSQRFRLIFSKSSQYLFLGYFSVGSIFWMAGSLPKIISSLKPNHCAQVKPAQNGETLGSEASGFSRP